MNEKDQENLLILIIAFFAFFTLYIKLEQNFFWVIVLLTFCVSTTLIFVFKPKKSRSITTKLLKKRGSINPKSPGKQGKKAAAYLGESFKSSRYFLSKKERVMHTMISGSTGSGKTTTLKSLFIDAMINDYPVLIIDPKGNSKTISEFRDLTRKFGKKDKVFNVFSIINPETSAHYNPLYRGSAVQIKDRLMGSLEWSEQFYKNQAASFLSSIIEVLHEIGEPITINSLHLILSNRKYAETIDDKIKSLPDKKSALRISDKFRHAMKRSDKNLDNLLSQLRDLDNLEFGNLLNPDEESNVIDLKSVINNREIAYFQLNTMAYETMAKVLGRLILNDLKALASQIHGGTIGVNTTFFPVFIDEFGSFCSNSFIELLKMCRDVDFAMHLFFQSLADLDAVSPEFKSQVQQNCLTKIIMRIDDPDEVDFWAKVAGTTDELESSFQTKTLGKLHIKTGNSTLRATKAHRVEHDVFKQLQIGEAVILQKNPSREDLIKLWNPR